MKRTRIIDPETERVTKKPARSLVEQLAGLALFDGMPIEPLPVKRVVEVRAHTRRVDGPVPPTGEERKEAALAKHEEREEVRVALAYVREKLIALYQSRVQWMAEDKHYVTPDDADKILREWPHIPLSVRDGNQSWRGSLFRGRGWQMLPMTVKSQRANQNATRIAAWIYVAPPLTQESTDE